MRAVVLRTFGHPVAVETVEDPVAGPGEVVVDVKAAPVLAYTREVLDGSRGYPLLLPIVPGCGAVGQIIEVGPGATRLREGDWVFCDPTVRARDDALTPDILLQGWIAPTEGARALQSHFRNGAFAERMLVPLECAYPLDGVVDAPSYCALGTLLVPYGGLLAAGVRPADTVLVSGATGHFGSAAVAVAVALGAQVIAAGRNEGILADLVRRFGPRVRPVVLTGRGDEDTERMKRTAGRPIDAVLDMLPPIDDTGPVRAATLAVRPNGVVVWMGGVREDVALPYGFLMRNGVTLRGQYMYPREGVDRLLGLIRVGLVDLGQFKVNVYPLEHFDAAVANAAQHGGPFRITAIRP